MPPLLSCLMTSTPVRLGALQRAILDFAGQTYQEKELIITVSDPAYAGNITSFLAQNAQATKDVSLYLRSAARTAKDGYVQALCQARGDYITFWDDANLNHPTRLAAQMKRQLEHPRSMTAFVHGMYFFYETNELFVVDFEQADAKPSDRCCVNTLIVPRKLLPQLDNTVSRTPVQQLADLADKTNLALVLLDGGEFAHIVGVVGNELRKDHRRLATEIEGVRDVSWLQANRPTLTACLNDYSWPGKVAVSGPDGIAFEYEPFRLWPKLYPVKPVEDSGVERVSELPTTPPKGAS